MEGIIIALFVCLVLALVSKYLTIPAIPFYIIAGVVLGKAGLGIVASDQISSFFSEMGLIFLLFFVGLGLKIDKISDEPVRGAHERDHRPQRQYVHRVCRGLPARLFACRVAHCRLCILYLQHRDGDHLA